MKHLKIFESYNQLPDIGDYVYIHINFYNYLFDDISDFLNNNVSKVVDYHTNSSTGEVDGVYLKFENIPEDLVIYFDYNIKLFKIEYIFSYGKTIEDAKMKKDTNKYNL